VVLAAGNAGYVVLRSGGGLVQANPDLSIGHPANLEEATAVGSVHKTNPFTYGMSFFSSRGPTADGRAKPDVVAPGEPIVLARHDWISGERMPPQSTTFTSSGAARAWPRPSCPAYSRRSYPRGADSLASPTASSAT